MKFKNLNLLFLSLLLSVLFAAFVSCGEDDLQTNKESDSHEYFDSISGGLNFNGETVKIIHWNNDFVNRELVADEVKNDALDKAVLERNKSVNERIGVNLKFIEGDIAPEYYMPLVEEDILAGSADFDIISGVQCQAGKLCAAGCYLDLSTAKYIDLTKSYWNSDYINQMKIGSSRLYMLGGDISLTTTAWASTMLYDKKMYSELFGSTDKFYDEILAGEWTLDVFFDKCRDAYSDLNGNKEKDEKDRFGLGIMTSGSVVDMFCFSSGVQFSSRDQNNYPKLDIDNQGTSAFLKIFNDAITKNRGIWAYNYEYQPNGFIQSLFEATTIDAIAQNTHDFDDFGVIPYPKLNDSIKKYRSWISDNTSVYSVPATLENSREDMVFTVLEAMASETRRICLPAYYETALKDKYTRDAQSRTMLDIIHDGATADFVSIYSESLGGIGTVMRQVFANGDGDIIKNFSEKIEEAKIKLVELISEYEKNTSDETDTQPPASSETDANDSLEYSPENEISADWEVFGGKYRTSGVLLNNDLSDSFCYTYSDDGGISVSSPPNSVKGGYFPTAAIQSAGTVPLNDLSVSICTDDGFSFDNVGYSASVSFVWTDKKIESLPQYTDQIGTNGLREAIPDDAHALSVVFLGTADTAGTVSNIMYIILHDGTETAPEIDHRVGYRWAIQISNDLSEGVEIAVSEDKTLGYVVSVNGIEYREGLRGGEPLPIDLTALKDVKEGNICIGVEATGRDQFSNFTLNTICGESARDFFKARTQAD